MHENYDEALLLELVKSKQFRALRAHLDEMNEVDISEFLDELEPDQQVVVFRLLPKDVAADVFTYLEDSEDQEKIINALSDKELREVLDELYLDDTVDIIEDMPANMVSRILRNTDASTRSQINQLLKYPEDSAGSIMTTEFIYLHPNATVEESFARIRKVGLDKETVYTCYVTQNRVLLGVVTVKTLLLSPYETKIKDIMETKVISVTTHEDKEDVAQMFSKYDLSALPVVDGENRLVGIITFDDAMDVMEEEATEDFEKMAAILPGDKPYLKTSVFETWRSRIPWLLMLMLSATFSGMIITHFEGALAACVVLTSFITMLSGTGGNSGSPMFDGNGNLRLPVVGGRHPRPVAGRGGVLRHAGRGVEGAAGGPSVRRVSGGGQLCEDDAGGPDAHAQPPGHCTRGSGGLPDPDVHRGLRQDRGLHPAHGGREDRHRPRRHGRPLHHHRGRCPVPADLLRHRHRDFGNLNFKAKCACVDLQKISTQAHCFGENFSLSLRGAS